MTGTFAAAWDHLRTELWEPLADYSRGEDSAPTDLFSDLFVTTDDFVEPSHAQGALEEARNDPAAARRLFLELRATDFASESHLVRFFEEVSEVVSDYDVPGFAEHYGALVEQLIGKLNLRYRVEPGRFPLRIRFLLPGSFSNIYEEIERTASGSAHLSFLLEDFEKAFDKYARTEDESDLRTCLAKASNYAEGLGSATYGAPSTLGKLCNELSEWPHDKLRDALKNVYHFVCDYPGIRHAGNQDNARRTLDARDLTIVSLLFMSFSGYLSPPMNQRAMFGL